MRSCLSCVAYAATFSILLSDSGRAQSLGDAGLPPRPAAISELAFDGSPATCAHPFGLREGQTLEYKLLNNKGKATGAWRYRVIKISTDSASGKKNKAVAITRIQLKSGLYDLTNHVLAQQDLTYFCRNDTTFTDGLGEISYEGLKSFRDRLMSYKGTPLAWPNQPAPGSALGEGGAVVQVSSPSVAIAKVKTTILKRNVVAGPDPVTVPAGTFSCYTVESQHELATAARVDLVLKGGGREVDYYDPAVGIVKTEYYDKKGKLTQTRVLSKH